MTNLDRIKTLNEYVEATLFVGRPLKLGAVLELRMKAYRKAKELGIAGGEAQ
jgi:hypothetical protein